MVPGQPFILVANHVSWFDIFAIAAKLPVDYHFVAKKELEKIRAQVGPPQGAFEALTRRLLVPDGQKLPDKLKDGKPIEVSLSASIVRDINGRPTSYLTMMADITERKRVEKLR